MPKAAGAGATLEEHITRTFEGAQAKDVRLRGPAQRTRHDLASEEFRTHIVLSSPAEHVMVIRGETDCLPG
ncbi:hypothetical protein [Nonomuraea fuscirosea]|uniref:hypothetical protein n=1 Tax=Nonomuraea fuscirosea TaxID=1291556 RepID=UPI000D04FF9D|nr:hypothetical protein [Nonomuraea fuscirosea]